MSASRRPTPTTGSSRSSTAPIAAPLQNGGRILQDPAIWWEAVDTALKGLDIKGHTVGAIAVDGTSGTILMVNADGTPAGLASMYNDVAEAADLAIVAAVAPAETAALGSTSPLARALPVRGDGLRASSIRPTGSPDSSPAAST